ncbi:MAG TPA: ROK family protein [Pantanalinema sp.]
MATNLADAYALGLDLGGTKILAGLVDGDGRVHAEWRLPTPTEGGGAAILAALVEGVGTLKAELSSEQRARLIGVGVSSAGQVNHATGVVEYCTPNLPGWSGTPVVEALERAQGIRACADNDANCAAFGEYWVGAGKGVQNLVALTIGTGLGGGIIANGELVRGARGGGAEIGHFLLVPDGLPCNCGQNGCIESYVSGTALARAAARSGHWTPSPSSHQIFEMARSGDAHALGLVREMARNLAMGIVTIIAFLDPERIVVGGGVSEQADLFLPLVREQIPGLYGERGWDTSALVPAALGPRAGMIGAAGQALARFGAAKTAVC